MADAKSLGERLNIPTGRLEPMLRLLADHAEQAPPYALLQVERLVTAGVEATRREARRLKELGEADDRVQAQEARAEMFAGALELLAKGKETLQAKALAKPMSIKGEVRTDAAVAGLTVEIAEDGATGFVAARTLTDEKGRFQVSLEEPLPVWGEAREVSYVAVASDERGAEVGRSESFPFKAGASIGLRIERGHKTAGKTGAKAAAAPAKAAQARGRPGDTRRS